MWGTLGAWSGLRYGLEGWLLNICIWLACGVDGTCCLWGGAIAIAIFAKPSTVWKVLKCGVFLVCIFPYSYWIRRNTPYLSVFSPNAGKYGPEKTPSLDTFHAVTTKRFAERRDVFRNLIHTFAGLCCTFPQTSLHRFFSSWAHP